ncbi:hypothetical protein DSCA_58950 [Desulfosarcina alkanivorans]|uniref:DUF5666 domain-containing protein n=1 Tax=Desulfosarcina alkanivorans TaxID=571177 RepID=A0A5K7YU72_9BACT|nr:DUF5666 domain-containing protein [Desulfosarcina alkanivorans]BBO71965.1 hypothetical protein DSCA_58950 [Desulfosarcina alkanivorans]
MKPTVNMLHLTVLFFLLTAASCGGGGEIADGGGIGGTGVVSTGSVTAIGSVWVNGVRFDTSEAGVYVGDRFQGSGDQAVIDNLDPGRVVRVIGRLTPDGNGNADRVYYDPLLVGPVQAIDTIDDSTLVLTILGQRVIVDDRTVLNNLSIDALTTENLAEVSGFFNEVNQIQATFLLHLADAAAPGVIFTITGPVSTLNPVNRTFQINDQEIDYRQVENGQGLPSGMADGSMVTVTGQMADNGAVFIAIAIGNYGRLGEIETDYMEIESIISAALDQNRFQLEGIPVEISPATEFAGGDSEDLLAGVGLEVEGNYSAGVVFAEKIAFNQVFRAESHLAEKDPSGNTLTLAGLDGLTLQVNALTRYSGSTDSFQQLNAGDHLVIKGWPTDHRTITATRIFGLPEVQNKIFLRGSVTSINDPVLTINGVAIDTDEIPDDGFFAADEMSVTKEVFFARLQENDPVAVRGELLAGNSVVWETITMGSEPTE